MNQETRKSGGRKIFFLLLVTCHLSLVTPVALATDLIFTNPPQTTDSANTLMQREAVSLDLLRTGITITFAAPQHVIIDSGPITFASPQHVIIDSGPAIAAGTNLIGKIGIDQTTPGTTNGVTVLNFPGTINLGNPLLAGTNYIGTIGVTKLTGAPNTANGQVTASTAAATLKAANSTRRSIAIVNTDASITVYVGIATVTAGNGFPLKAGQSMSIDSTALIQVIAVSGSPVVAYLETYD